jgi:predicted phosphodiesterase
MDDILRRLEGETPEVEQLRRRVFELERRLLSQGDLEKRTQDAENLNRRLERELGLLTRVGDVSQPPTWLNAVPRPASGHHATAWLMLSDLHLDEVVELDEVMGVNKFDRDIAKGRLERTFTNFVRMMRDTSTSVTLDGAVICLGGDIFSGDLHEELTETNEDTMLGSLDFWIDHLAAGLSLMVEEFGKVHVPVVVGNHGRTTRKPRAKLRARDNFDWFMGKALARIFANDPRVTFDVAEAADTLIPSYGRKVMLTHGDQASGGAGIGGIWSPIMRLDARKRQRSAAFDMPYDLLLMGHWHQLVFGPSFIVNGSLKGVDEYAFVNNFTPEPPQQAAWLMTPEHGRTLTVPIFCQNRTMENW